MIKSILLNIRSFKRKKNFKNYMFLNITICILLFIVLIIRSYSQEQINSIVNGKDNRLVFIHNVEKIDLFNDFLGENKGDIDRVNYQISINDYIIDNKKYNISTSDEDMNNAVMINPSYDNNSIKIDDLQVSDIFYDSSLNEGDIVINNDVAKYLIDKKTKGEKSISFYVKDYYAIENILEKLNDKGISANSNNGC